RLSTTLRSLSTKQIFLGSVYLILVVLALSPSKTSKENLVSIKVYTKSSLLKIFEKNETSNIFITIENLSKSGIIRAGDDSKLNIQMQWFPKHNLAVNAWSPSVSDRLVEVAGEFAPNVPKTISIPIHPGDIPSGKYTVQFGFISRTEKRIVDKYGENKSEFSVSKFSLENVPSVDIEYIRTNAISEQAVIEIRDHLIVQASDIWIDRILADPANVKSTIQIKRGNQAVEFSSDWRYIAIVKNNSPYIWPNVGKDPIQISIFAKSQDGQFKEIKDFDLPKVVQPGETIALPISVTSDQIYLKSANDLFLGLSTKSNIWFFNYGDGVAQFKTDSVSSLLQDNMKILQKIIDTNSNRSTLNSSKMSSLVGVPIKFKISPMTTLFNNEVICFANKHRNSFPIIIENLENFTLLPRQLAGTNPWVSIYTEITSNNSKYLSEHDSLRTGLPANIGVPMNLDPCKNLKPGTYSLKIGLMASSQEHPQKTLLCEKTKCLDVRLNVY
ncbi:MAG: hypothetical protein KDD61_07310, partial [Bdellovibrionales bacterium]|nr:hypothetical protein [Bdellovibrionales bacterium]